MPLEIENPVRIGVARQIAENIRGEILNGRLRSDERLPTEHELAELYSVSRPTIREALKRLAAQNLIRSQRGPTGGNFIKKPCPAEITEYLSNTTRLMVGMGEFDIDQIAAARLEMEIVCCRLAAANRREDHLDRLRAEIALQEDTTIDDVEFCETDVRFHRAIVDASGNALLALMTTPVIEGLLPVSNLITFRVRDRQCVVDFHKQMLDGIVRRNADKAIKALTKLSAYMRERYDVARMRRQS